MRAATGGGYDSGCPARHLGSPCHRLARVATVLDLITLVVPLAQAAGQPVRYVVVACSYTTSASSLEVHQLVISVDAKNNELVGACKNTGAVNAHYFVDPEPA